MTESGFVKAQSDNLPKKLFSNNCPSIMSTNPFAALISSEIVNSSANSDTSIRREAVECLKINDILEKIFNFTLNKKNKNVNVVFLEEIAKNVGEQDWIDLEILDQCVFERLMLPYSNEEQVLNNNQKSNKVLEKKIVPYLFKSFLNAKNYEHSNKSLYEKVLPIIFQNIVTPLRQPELFPDQDISKQLFELIFYYNCCEFFTLLARYFKKDGDEEFLMSFKPVLIRIHAEIAKSTLVTLNQKLIEFILFLSGDEIYAEVFIDYNTPVTPCAGIAFANTLLGALLCLSVLPKVSNGPYEYYDRPIEQANSTLEGNLWTSTNTLRENLHKVFLNLLKKPSKAKTLIWLGKCLETNASRGKLWNSHAHMDDLNPSNFTSVSDGFMLNLSAILLKLCHPFCSNVTSGKILKVDPTYCAVEDKDTESKNVHLLKMSEETCLLPTSEESENISRPVAKSYTFLTECFFLTHRSLDLGFLICTERLLRLNQEIGRIQRTYNDALMQAGGFSDVMESLKIRMETKMQRYLSLKTALLEPNFISDLMCLHSATAVWLNQVSLHTEFLNNESYAPMTFKDVEFPLNDSEISNTLRCVPEFLIENIVGFLSFLRRFSPRSLEEGGYQALEPILTMVLIFMGSPERLRNPHVRALLAEVLEAMLPVHKDEPDGLNNLGGLQRTKLFTEHPHRNEIVRTLLNVFISIEMTGQSVQFEEKFNYRRPMYLVMDYLWELEEHRKSFVNLAKEAEENMEAVNPPIYLRFVNLLMNDAVFLLDESLSNMAQIRTMETARANGEWDQLSSNEREQNFATLRQIGTLARFDNILGRDTTRTLRLVTANTTSVFTHSTMVDRVAATLNYFLLHLVGPKKKNFKVKDLKEYEFDPANTVLDICHIYVSLGSSDSFCLAVSQDGRSYNSNLFSLAENVLARIGGAELISELRLVANKVEKLAEQQKTDEEIFSDVPDEFLDPIMSTVMLDPVILPSSKQTVDRTTIARHLLSDQTDPFNRSPLTMDQVEPNTELAEQIQNWIERKKSEKNLPL